MTINHIDHLTEWWENAEVPTSTTLPRDGDRIIIRYNPEWYEIATADGDADEHELSADTRILSRAPKPKPAWHDAKAVIAHVGGNELPRVLARDDDGAFVDGVTGHAYAADRLRDVTPLIEAKVTDEMVQNALTFWEANDPEDEKWARAFITAALGLETE